VKKEMYRTGTVLNGFRVNIGLKAFYTTEKSGTDTIKIGTVLIFDISGKRYLL